jgi:sterol desaturase/sphingolipid hydroxylase (fatty acid hydroxylase superfamily)
MLETTVRLAFSLATFGTMAAWEYALPRRDLIEPRPRRWPTNLGLALLNAILVRILAGGAIVSAAAFSADRGAGLLHWVPVPVWAAWMITILGLDFAVYLQHVMFHAVPAFWRLHRVHHADLGFDATTGLRFHPIEILVSVGLKSAVVVLLGGVPWAVVVFEILLNASSLFNHGNVVIREDVDRWLRWFIVTPDMHRIHHSSRVVETNSNFGFSFSFWDRLCGTYRPEPALGQLGLEIGLSEYRKFLQLGELLVLPFRGPAGSYTFAGTRPVQNQPDHALGSPSDTPSTIPPSELRERLSRTDPPLVLDVRSPAEVAGPLGHLEGAVNIPVDDLSNRLDDLGGPRTRLLVPV